MRNDQPKSTPPIIFARARELRHELTTAEAILWNTLRDRRFNGLKFRRQHPIGRFTADFYCAECRLVIELDGGVHRDTIEEDLARAQQMADYGYHVIRFNFEEIENNIPHVLPEILVACSTPSKK